MSFATWTPTASAKPNTFLKHGGGPLNNVYKYLTKINLGLLSPNFEPGITTPTHFYDGALRLRDMDDNADSIFDTSDLDLDADVHQYMKIPVITNVEGSGPSAKFKDRLVVEKAAQVLEQKTIILTDNHVKGTSAAAAGDLVAFTDIGGGVIDLRRAPKGTAGQIPTMNGSANGLAWIDPSSLFGTGIITDSMIASHTSTKITITNRAQLPSAVAYLDTFQTFTNSQQISVASATPMTVRNATNVAGSTVGVMLHLRNASNVNTAYSKAESRIVTNTAGAEDGTYDIWTIKGGTLRQVVVIDDEMFTFGRIGERIIFDTSLINTTSKTIQWGNFGGTPVIEDATQPLSNKTITSSTIVAASNTLTGIVDANIGSHTSTKITITNKAQLPSDSLYNNDGLAITNKILDLRKISVQRLSRTGRITPDNPGGEGNLRNTNVMGDDGGISSNTAGRYRILNTTATAGDWCGYAKLDNYTCRRSGAPLIRWAFLYKTAGSKRRFTGLKATKGIVTTTSNSAPLASGEAGFMFGYGIGDTEWQIFYNDSTGTCNKEALTGIAIPGADTNYIVEMAVSNAASGSFSISFFNVNSDGSKGSQIGSTVTKSTTEIPGSTTDLYYNDILVSTGTAVLPHTLHYVEIEN